MIAVFMWGREQLGKTRENGIEGVEIQRLQGQTFPTSPWTWDEREDGYAQIYVGFVSWSFDERDAEPYNNNEDDESRDEEEGPGELEVVCQEKWKRRCLAGAEVICP